ncbi:MAG: hypothetical protein ABIQ95_00765 [Bdellovibrionia bacterium]
MKKKLKAKKEEEDSIDRIIEEPVRHIQGVYALVDAVRSEAWEEFPMDRHGIDYSFGDIELELGDGNYIPIRDITEHMNREQFNTPDDLLMGIREALLSWKGIEIPLDQINRPEDQVAS